MKESAPLSDTIITHELDERPAREPDFGAESQALAHLMEVMANGLGGDDAVFHHLVETALKICKAQSAGVSILEKCDGQEVFRWRAAVGRWSSYRGDTMPRESPCGIAVNSNTSVLMSRPERYFNYASNITLPMSEVLLVPFHFKGKPIGTIWLIAHDESLHFDAEDRRLLTSLARFAANAYQLLHQQKLASEREAHTRMLLREVSHRSKNLLAVVQSIARQTAKNADPAAFADDFSERLAGIAASQDLLVRNDWRGVDMGDLARSQVMHLSGRVGERICFRGEPLRLSPAAAQAIGMALHELSTNAAKYGALTGPEGSVSVAWELASDDRFHLRWCEQGGPAVRPPWRLGFGHWVITQSVEHALDATVWLDFADAGVRWRLDAPAAEVLDKPADISL